MVDLSKFTFNTNILSIVVACNQFWVKLCPLKKKILNPLHKSEMDQNVFLDY